MSASGPISFTVPGHPHGKGRPRAVVRGNFARLYTPAETVNYEGAVKIAAAAAMKGRVPIERPVALVVSAIFDIPKGFSRTKRQAALDRAEFPAKKPDLDNIVKAITDGMNGVVFKDDAQIVSTTSAKVYGPIPHVLVTVRSL